MIAAILFSCVAPLIVTIHIFQYKVYLKEVKSNGFMLAYAALTGTNLIVYYFDFFYKNPLDIFKNPLDIRTELKTGHRIAGKLSA
ncbi:unnamed protein product [Meloidogyne enterolobii]|uniref:Uncharacterized protein n=1 Tax=Meloidogyne enterolobii TaxID=390850 RepID=A0ACB1A878_MELEN